MVEDLTIVIAGPDPAIHAEAALARIPPQGLNSRGSAWMRGSSPRMTRKKTYRALGVLLHFAA
jgi:hypothetical protein